MHQYNTFCTFHPAQAAFAEMIEAETGVLTSPAPLAVSSVYGRVPRIPGGVVTRVQPRPRNGPSGPRTNSPGVRSR